MTEIVMPPNKIALILDGVVLDILHTDDRLAAIFLSNPTIIAVNDEVKVGDPA